MTLNREHRHELRSVCTIALVAWIFRMCVAGIAYGNRDIVGMLWPRGVEALGIARSLLNGHGFSSPFAVPTGPTAFLPPVYPVILAVIENFFGIATRGSAWAILTMQSFFSAAACVAVYYFAKQFFEADVARRAAWMWALFPYAVILPTNIVWESPLSALSLITGMFLLTRATHSESAAHWTAIGAYFSFTCMINAGFLSVLPSLLLYLAVKPRYRRRAVLCAAGFIVCLLPWTIRNYAIFHSVIPVRDTLPLEMWIGNRTDATTEFTPEIHPAFSSSELQDYQRLGEIGYMSQKRDLVLKFLRENPLLFVRNTVNRIWLYWFNLRALWLLVPVLNLIGLAGLWILIRRSHPMSWAFVIPLLVFPLPYYLTHPDLRYQHPLQTLLVVLAAYVTVLGSKMIKARRINGRSSAH